MGFGGEKARKATQQSTDHMEGIIQSSTLMANVTHRLLAEWFEFAHERTERNLERVDSLLHSRTQHDSWRGRASLCATISTHSRGLPAGSVSSPCE
jgi:hypothetical protein